jgi:hypothetical protein
MKNIFSKLESIDDIDGYLLAKSLVAFTVSLVAVNFINQLLGEPQHLVTRMIDLDTEANLPTWFSGCLHAIAAYFAYQVSIIAGSHRGRRLWQVVSLVFVLMSCDEVAQIHESVGVYFVNHHSSMARLKISPWLVVLGVPLLAGFAILARKVSLYIKRPKTRFYFGIGLLCLIGGAFILESTLRLQFFQSLGKIRWIWLLEKDLEEGLEMVGVILMIRGLLDQRKFLVDEQNRVAEEMLQTVSLSTKMEKASYSKVGRSK